MVLRKISAEVALNDVLMVGPALQDDLFTILTRYRIYRRKYTAKSRFTSTKHNTKRDGFVHTRLLRG